MFTTFFTFAVATLGVMTAVGDSPVAQPICCMKRAYCCSVKQSCCRKTEASNTPNSKTTAAMAGMRETAQPTCCMKRAYCCSVNRPCCRATSVEITS